MPRNAVGNCCGGWGKHALYLSPFCHHFNQTNVHYNPFRGNCQEEKFEKSEKKRGFWALFIKIVELYKIYQITFQERLTVVTNLQEIIGQKKNDFRSGLLGMSRKQIKSFLVQQFFKNAAEVWASSPHLRSKLFLRWLQPMSRRQTKVF